MNAGRRIEDPRQFGRVAVLMGGESAEREVSLKSGHAVLAALLKQGVDAVGVDLVSDPVRAIAATGCDRVFNIMHGRGGEDGVLQGLLSSLQIPYTGSGVLASALSMDKLRAKWLWKGAGIPTPAWTVLESEADLSQCESELGYPVMIKPSLEGSSIGMAKATDRETLSAAWIAASRYDCPVFAEAWVQGAEYTAGILDNRALPLIRLETPRAFYDYEAKYLADSTRYFCPCGLAPDLESELQRLALAACHALGVAGWARADILMDEAARPWLIDVNTVPGMTDHSLVPMAARAAGMDFDELVWRILETSLD